MRAQHAKPRASGRCDVTHIHAPLFWLLGCSGEEPEPEYDGRWEVEGPACFNCGEPGHTFRDCPKPRDRAAIQAARDATRRYTDVKNHGDVPLLPPAHMSDELLAALGCARGEWRAALAVARWPRCCLACVLLVCPLVRPPLRCRCASLPNVVVLRAGDPLPWAAAAQRFGCPPAYYVGGQWPPPKRIHCDLSAPPAPVSADAASGSRGAGATDGAAAAAAVDASTSSAAAAAAVTSPAPVADAAAVLACPAPLLPVPPSQTAVGRYAGNGDLSRVVALFDAGYHPLPPGMVRAAAAGAASAAASGEDGAGLRMICSDDEDEEEEGDGCAVASDAQPSAVVASRMMAACVAGSRRDAGVVPQPVAVLDHVAHPAAGLPDCPLLRGLRLAPMFPVCGHAGGGAC